MYAIRELARWTGDVKGEIFRLAVMAALLGDDTLYVDVLLVSIACSRGCCSTL